jgi:hypothetical protein
VSAFFAFKGKVGRERCVSAFFAFKCKVGRERCVSALILKGKLEESDVRVFCSVF